jgi:hypothetical protein
MNPDTLDLPEHNNNENDSHRMNVQDIQNDIPTIQDDAITFDKIAPPPVLLPPVISRPKQHPPQGDTRYGGTEAATPVTRSTPIVTNGGCISDGTNSDIWVPNHISVHEYMNPNKRPHMEDVHVILPAPAAGAVASKWHQNSDTNAVWNCSDPTITYIGIYDGHGGMCAVFFLGFEISVLAFGLTLFVFVSFLFS